MKICVACKERFDSPRWECTKCAFIPDFINDYPAFSKELAYANEGFKESLFSELASLEDNNFWFKARNQLIIWSLAKYFSKAQNFLEIGCGTGYVLSGLHQTFPGLKLTGSEIFSEGLFFAAQRIKVADLFQMDARNIPFENEFDVIGAFDVLEHIEDDKLVLRQMHQAIKPGGGIIISVPQHQFLWSQQDELSCHFRRYDVTDLKEKVISAGFKVVRATSFVSLLLPLMLASRFMRRKSNNDKYDVLAELKVPFFINFSFEKILAFERFLIRSGVSFPAGGSLLLIAQKM